MSCSLRRRLGASLVSTLEARNNDDVTDKDTTSTQVTTAGLSAKSSAPKPENNVPDRTTSSIIRVRATDLAEQDGTDGASGERRGRSPNSPELEDVVQPKESPIPLPQNPSIDTVVTNDQDQQRDATRPQTNTALLPRSVFTTTVSHIGVLSCRAPPLEVSRDSHDQDAGREVQRHCHKHQSSSPASLVVRLDRVRQRCRSMRSDLDSLSSRCDILFSELEAVRARLNAGKNKLHGSRAVVPVARVSWNRYPETPRVNEPGLPGYSARRLFFGSSFLLLSPTASQMSPSWPDAEPTLHVATQWLPRPNETERIMTNALLKSKNWVLAGSALERQSCALGAELRLKAGSARAIAYHGTNTKDYVSDPHLSMEVNRLDVRPELQPSPAFSKCEKRQGHDYPVKVNSPDDTSDRDPTEDENTPVIEAMTCLESFTDSGKLKPRAVVADYRSLQSSTMVHTPPTSDESSGSVDIYSTGNLPLLTVSGSQLEAPQQHDAPCEQQAQWNSREGKFSPSVAKSATTSEGHGVRKSGNKEISIRISQLESLDHQMERRDGISHSGLQSEIPSSDQRHWEETEGDVCSTDESEGDWKDYYSPSYWCDSLHTSYLLTPDTKSGERCQNTAHTSIPGEQSKQDGSPLLESGTTDVLKNSSDKNKAENRPVSDIYSNTIYDVNNNNEDAYYLKDSFSRDKLFDDMDCPVARSPPSSVVSISVTRTAPSEVIVSSPPVSTTMPARSQESSKSSNSEHCFSAKTSFANNLRLKTSLIPRLLVSALKREVPVSDAESLSDESGYRMIQTMTRQTRADEAKAGAVVTWSNQQTAHRVSHDTIMVTLKPMCLPQTTEPPANTNCHRSVIKARRGRKPRVRSYTTLEGLSCSLNFLRTGNWPVLVERDRKPCCYCRGLKWSRFANGGHLHKTGAPNTEQNPEHLPIISSNDPFVCSCQSKQFHSDSASRIRIVDTEELAVKIQKVSQVTVAERRTRDISKTFWTNAAVGATTVDSSQARKRGRDSPGTATFERCASFNLCQAPRRKGAASEAARVVPRTQTKRDLSCIVEDASKEMDEENVTVSTTCIPFPASSGNVVACTPGAATALQAAIQNYSGKNEFSQTSATTIERSVTVVNGMDTPGAVSTVSAAITSKSIKQAASVKSSELGAQVSSVKSELVSSEVRVGTLNAGSLPSLPLPLSTQTQTWTRGATGELRFAPVDTVRKKAIQPVACTAVNGNKDAREGSSNTSLRHAVDSNFPDTSSRPVVASQRCTPLTSTPIVSCTESRNPPTHHVLSPVLTQTHTADQSAVLDAPRVSECPTASNQWVSLQANLLAAFQESLCQPANSCVIEPHPGGVLQTTYIVSTGVAPGNPSVWGSQSKLCGSEANRKNSGHGDCSSFQSQHKRSGLVSESAVDSAEDNSSIDDDHIANVKRRKMDKNNNGQSSAGCEMKIREEQYPGIAAENSSPPAEDKLAVQDVDHTAGNEATAKVQSRPKPLLPTPAFRRPPPNQRRPTCLQGIAKCGHWPCSLVELPVHHAHWVGCYCAAMDRLILGKPVVNERRGDWRKQQEEWCCAQGKPYNGPATRCAVQGGVSQPQPRLLVP